MKRDNCSEVVTDTLDLSDGAQFWGRYCSLKYDADSKKIVSFLYIGEDSLYPTSLFSIVGKSISYLNGLEKRVNETCITDIVNFLSDSWSASYFHDEFFPSLVESLKSDPELVAKAKNYEKTLDEDVYLYLLSFLQDTREMSSIYHYYMPEDAQIENVSGA